MPQEHYSLVWYILLLIFVIIKYLIKIISSRIYYFQQSVVQSDKLTYPTFFKHLTQTNIIKVINLMTSFLLMQHVAVNVKSF